MREPLKLAEQTILAALQTHFPISISALTFLPIGPDSDSTAYCVQADNGGVYFLKIRAGKGFSPPSLFCFDPQTPPDETFDLCIFTCARATDVVLKLHALPSTY
jgi:hypothetical protein